MVEHHEPRPSGYWYEPGARVRSVDVLNLLRRYRSAEGAMRARTRESMGMGETDLLALRFLLQAKREGRSPLQRDLAAFLGISSASTTALVDRLVKSGHVERRPHPDDRRASIVTATTESDHEVRATLGAMHQRMIAVVDDLSPDDLDAVARFLSGMIRAVSEEEDLDRELRDVVRDFEQGTA